ncbi:MAG: sugar phosphate isomerase/epimerase [Rhodospirillaceae bacterium]|nr:sugar phosphate isomerase/epimerase [Rhodospirillaceae bacterium]
MRFSLCNEVLRDLDFAAQCDFAAALGYDGLEVAPFTLGDAPDKVGSGTIRAMRSAAEASGIAITGLHWLLIKPEGLSIVTEDAAVLSKTTAFLERMVELCGELGGSVLVHGSPAQRRLGEDREAGLTRAMKVFEAVARASERAGVIYCLEPLSRHETNFVNTLDEAAAIVGRVGSPNFRTMIDTSAAGLTEDMPVADLIRKWMPTGLLAHVQLNDTNRREPGAGEDDFPAILRALVETGYGDCAAIEPFVYTPDGPAAAARAIGFIRGILAGLSSFTGSRET